MHEQYLPGWPWVDWSDTPGIISKTFMMMRRIVRPIVALARLPGPNTLPAAFMPRSVTAGPATISRGAEPPVLAVEPWKLYPGSLAASRAATTTGKYSGRQPAMTAFTAAARMLHSSPVVGCVAMTVSGGRPSIASIASTRDISGGTTGRPSVQPRS